MGKLVVFKEGGRFRGQPRHSWLSLAKCFGVSQIHRAQEQRLLHL